METVAEYSEDVPNWALSYIVNGDASGLESDETAMVDEWMAFFSEKAKELGGNVVYSTTDESDDFCSTPAFGLACDTTKTDVLILA